MRSRVLRSKLTPNVAHTASGQGPLLMAAFNTGQEMGFAVGVKEIAAKVPTLPLSGTSFGGSLSRGTLEGHLVSGTDPCLVA